MELMEILAEEEREARKLDLERKSKNIFKRFIIGLIKNILETLERR